jgi:hypothetical protein
MRTTLTIEDDVAVQLERLRKARKTTLKQLVNEALRAGLRQLVAPPARGKPYRTPSVNLGRCLVESLDNIGEVLAIAEGDDHK